MARLKRDYLRVKTVDLLLEDEAGALVKTDEASGQPYLSIQLPALAYEEAANGSGIKVLKAQGHGLKLEIDTARSPLEPVIAAIMRRGHIVDMTIADPPMEEIIAMMYRQAGRETSEIEQLDARL